MPQIHRMTLMYIVFLQDMFQNAETNGTNAQQLAATFGLAHANPARRVKDTSRTERINAVAVAKLIKSVDPTTQCTSPTRGR
jgi:hypothetical protein